MKPQVFEYAEGVHSREMYGGIHTLDFWVTEPIKLIGAGIYGPVVAGPATIELNVFTETLMRVNLQSLQNDIQFDGTPGIVSLLFESPVYIPPKKVFTIQLNISEPKTYYGYNGQDSVESAGVTFIFKHSVRRDLGSDGITNTLIGNFPVLYFMRDK